MGIRTVSAWEPELTDEQKENWKRYLLRMVNGDDVGMDRELLGNLTVWVDGRFKSLTPCGYWEITRQDVYLPMSQNVWDFHLVNRSDLGKIMLVVLRKLGLEEERELIDWFAGLVSEDCEDSLVYGGRGRPRDGERERIAVGPKGELALQVEGEWLSQTGERKNVDGWTILEV